MCPQGQSWEGGTATKTENMDRQTTMMTLGLLQHHLLHTSNKDVKAEPEEVALNGHIINLPMR